VAAVKTCQRTNPAGSSSSSVAAQGLQSWEELDNTTPQLPASYHVYDAQTLLTHVNAAQVAGLMSNKFSSGRKSQKGKKGTEKSVAIGNEGGTPWLKSPNSRSVEISTVETLNNALFLASSTTVPTFVGFSFTISQVNDFSSFSSIFDQYHIRLIEVLIEPQITEVLSAATDVSELITVVDVDDANTPTNYNDLGSYPTVVQARGTQAHYHRWVPSVAVAVYSGAFTSFAATTSMWLDCGSSGIQHYGLKGAAQVAAQLQTYTYQAKLHVSWRARH